jgi:hypothetical protein
MRKTIIAALLAMAWVGSGCNDVSDGSEEIGSQQNALLLNPYLSDVQIKWDNGKTVSHYLYKQPGVLTMLTDKNQLVYNSGASDAFFTSSAFDPSYRGCGIAAAQSVLKYFGINLSRADINSRYIPSHQVPGGLIYVRPSSLRDGLIRALYDYAGVGYLQTAGRGVKVVLETGQTTADIAQHLATGYPVIALVNGGSHYVVAVASFGNGNFKVIDSTNGPNNLWTETLDLNFDIWSSIAQYFQGDPNWAPGMIIHFDPIPLPTSACGAGQKDCSPPLGHCTAVGNYCCGGYGCTQACAHTSSGKSYCP